jgi:hypothetical protein
MSERAANCSCAYVRAAWSGEPLGISRSMASPVSAIAARRFGVQAWSRRDQLSITGTCTAHVRAGEAGRRATFQICPSCGSTAYWELNSVPGRIAVALGKFADPQFPAPHVSVWERRRHPWTVHISDCQLVNST